MRSFGKHWFSGHWFSGHWVSGRWSSGRWSSGRSFDGAGERAGADVRGFSAGGSLELVDVQVSRGGRQLFDPLSFTCQAGDVVGIIGPNGSGKSSLLSAIAGTGVRFSGQISYARHRLADVSAAHRAGLVAFATQDSQASNELLVRDIVRIGTVAHARSGVGSGAGSHSAGLIAGSERDVTAAAMAKLGILDLAERHYSTLSGGQKQLVQMARVLAQQTPVLLLDEPTSALDPAHQLSVMATLTEQAAAGSIVLVTLHDLSAALHSCTKLLLLTGDGNHMVGPPGELLRPDIIHKVYGVDAELLTSAQSGRSYINLIDQAVPPKAGP